MDIETKVSYIGTWGEIMEVIESYYLKKGNKIDKLKINKTERTWKDIKDNAPIKYRLLILIKEQSI
jgi:hypothetical protein